MYKPDSIWTWAFVGITFVQAAIILSCESWVSLLLLNRNMLNILLSYSTYHGLELKAVGNWWCSSLIRLFSSYLFAKIQTGLEHSGIPPEDPKSQTIPTFLALYIFAFLFQLLLVFDALRAKNTIQVIGLCIFNAALLLYAAIQYNQIRDSDTLDEGVWIAVKPFLVAVPCIIALGLVLMSVAAWKLYDEFAWTIYKEISADLKMKRRYLTYQVRISDEIPIAVALLINHSRFTSLF